MDLRELYAWIDLMPPKPDKFHVSCEVQVNNPGLVPKLMVRVPQGFNPQILLLDLYLVQQSGFWPQVSSMASASYDKILTPGSLKYTSVEIFSENKSIAQANVEIIQ